MALDAITTPILVNSIPHMGKVLFCLNGNEADTSAGIEIKATPGAGQAIYITSIILGSDDADAHPYITDGDDAVLFGPLYSTVEAPHLAHKFDNPLRVTSNKGIKLNAAAAGNVFVHVEGATATG